MVPFGGMIVAAQYLSVRPNQPSAMSVCVFALVALSAVGVVLGQRTVPPRQLAPGVLTTISPAPQAEELYSGPQPLVELPVTIANLQYEPKLSSTSSTIYERAKDVLLRRTIWNLEFSFKPMRMITVDVPQASGRMQRQQH